MNLHDVKKLGFNGGPIRIKEGYLEARISATIESERGDWSLKDLSRWFTIHWVADTVIIAKEYV